MVDVDVSLRVCEGRSGCGGRSECGIGKSAGGRRIEIKPYSKAGFINTIPDDTQAANHGRRE